MEKKVLAFAGSNHAASINHQLLEFTASLVNGAAVTVLDLRSWDIPMYSIDLDPDQTPELITQLIEQIQAHDGFIIASPEHNGGTPAFFKNILDWLSRRAKQVFDQKPVLLMSTSPGQKGGANNALFLSNTLPYQGATIAGTFSLPSFHQTFQEGQVVAEQLEALQGQLDLFQAAL